MFSVSIWNVQVGAIFTFLEHIFKEPMLIVRSYQEITFHDFFIRSSQIGFLGF